ncbi:helix-turn-helix domain-containing protein [Gallaecimonas mangrovi]|uniref:helix-turn-helix domain-containing protein n=1 Tax=Gallaecimonas mangrovi TaxID=2291597 RepID=UPI000E206163|nr:XRE family transcriptional regulator [Gallaecimonas mangrovi]
MNPLTQQIQAVLKSARADKGWSLSVAAEKTGVSKAMLGQIERGESSPTVATLWKLATGFGLSFSSFLLTGCPSPLPDIDKMKVVTLFPYNPQLGFEMFAITLAPGFRRQSEPHEAGVVEHVIALDGPMEVLQAGQWQALEAGAGLRFDASLEHGYGNPGPLPVTFHNVICYPGKNPA